MNNSIEWQVIENKNNEIKELVDKVNILEKQNTDVLNKLDSIEKIELDLETIIRQFLVIKEEVPIIEDETSSPKNMQLGIQFQPYDLSNNYINRMTNRLWRNSSYVTTPNFLFTNLNQKKN